MCIECDLNRTYLTRLCVKDRKVWKCRPWPGGQRCPTCGDAGLSMGWRWRPPRLSNERAWKLIEKGDYLWDKRAIAKNKNAQRELALKDYWFWQKHRSKKK